MKNNENVKTVPLKVESTIKENLIMSKQVQDRLEKDENDEFISDYPKIDNVVEENIDRTNINRDILDIFPDIGVAPKIIKAVILNGTTSYATRTPLPPTVGEDVALLLKEVLVDRYELPEELPDTIDELFEKGSSAFLTIPSQELLKITNSVTHMKKDKTLSSVYKRENGDEKLKPYTRISNESDLSNHLDTYSTIFKSNADDNKLLLSVTDSLDVFPMSEDLEANLIHNVHKNIKTSNESSEKPDDVLDVLFKNIVDKEDGDKQITEEISISSGSEPDNLGDGVHMKLNSDLVVPLNINGNKKKPIGYLLLANENWKLLGNSKRDYNNETDIISSEGSTADLKKEIDRLKKSLSSNRDVEEIEITDKFAYQELINKHIADKITESNIGNLVEFDRNEQILEVMFHRALEARSTKLIYVPEELLTYYAFQYNDNGTGRSMIDDVAHLISIRAMLTFAKIRSEIENAIPKKIVEIKIDPKNKRPEKTFAKYVDSYGRSLGKTYKWGTTSIKGTSEWIQSVGVSFRVQHPKIPYNEISETTSNFGATRPIEIEFLNDIRNSIFRRFGLTTSMIDDSAKSDFATLSVIANDLSRKEMSELQLKILKFNSKHAVRILKIDRIFNNKLRAIVEKEQDSIVRGFGQDIIERIGKLKRTKVEVRDWIIRIITQEVHASLPTLRNEDDDMLSKRFRGYRDMIEDVIENSLLSPESVPRELVGEGMESALALFKTSYKNSLLRKWMIDNDYMVEVAELLEVNDGVLNIAHLKEYIGKLDKLVEALKPYGKHFKDVRKKGEKLGNMLIEDNAPEPEEKTVINYGDNEPDPEVTDSEPEGDPVKDEKVTIKADEPDVKDDVKDETVEPDTKPKEADKSIDDEINRLMK